MLAKLADSYFPRKPVRGPSVCGQVTPHWGGSDFCAACRLTINHYTRNLNPEERSTRPGQERTESEHSP